MSIDRSRLRDLLASERAEYARRNPRSRELYDAGEHLFGRVPMPWMNKAAGGFPLGLDRADGARVWDLDGHEYIDFCLGDTGAMAGHSPRAGRRGGGETVRRTRWRHRDDADAGRRMGCRRAEFATRRRPVTERYGVLLVNDETHTFSAGVGRATGPGG